VVEIILVVWFAFNLFLFFRVGVRYERRRAKLLRQEKTAKLLRDIEQAKPPFGQQAVCKYVRLPDSNTGYTLWVN